MRHTGMKCAHLLHRHCFPSGVITHAVRLYFRFPPNLRMVEDLLAERGIINSHQTVRAWAEKFFCGGGLLKRPAIGRWANTVTNGI